MFFQVKLTAEARENYIHIEHYLSEEFGEKVVNNFKLRLEQCFLLIAENPHLFPVFSEVHEIRRAVLRKEVSIYYTIEKKEVHILSMFDNRKAPKDF